MQELIGLWFFEAGKYQGFPLDDHLPLEIALTPFPQMTKLCDRYIYYPNTAEVPESRVVIIRNCSYAIRAEVEIPVSGACGVLFAHYEKDGKLDYVYNFVGITEHPTVR